MRGCVVMDTHGWQRSNHWIRRNHQCRIPKRHVYFDTESRSAFHKRTEVQTWRVGAAIRWRYGLKSGDRAEAETFTDPMALWRWVDSFTRPETRTVVWCHNLGHDTRIAAILECLPKLGWQLEWCNLDRNVSSMTWRSDHGTLVFADTWTWLPMELSAIAPSVSLRKMSMPPQAARPEIWARYCQRDVEIGYRVVTELLKFIGDQDLGNWQPTGAGMAYATWRHKFLTHKVLVHDDDKALAAEREAMHTGRAEAWRHGDLRGDTFTEVDLKDAYIRIAAENDLPTKLKEKTRALTLSQYRQLKGHYKVLARCYVATSEPIVPTRYRGRIIWPTGSFETWLWDPEVDLLIEAGQTVRIREAYLYTAEPILKQWAQWILSVTGSTDDSVPPCVKTFIKHCGRAMIGRLSLRSPTWEKFGGNPDGHVGISYELDTLSGRQRRMLHIGSQTLRETERREGQDSLPQVTGYVMSKCRVLVWRAMQAAGVENVVHVDTDAIIVTRAGLDNLLRHCGEWIASHWQIKGSWCRLIVYAPRNYRTTSERKCAGVPRKAKEVATNRFKGERWVGLASDIQQGRHMAVTVIDDEWTMRIKDPRRQDAPGVATMTVAFEV